MSLRLDNMQTAEMRTAAAQQAMIKNVSLAIQDYMDSKAQTRSYDNAQSAITYRGDANSQFAAEAETMFAWRSTVWTYSTSELGKIASGLRPVPTTEEFLQEIETACPFAWP